MEVALDAQGNTAKVRNPVLVAVFTLITIGIYGIYWWYKVNKEMVDYGRAQNAQGLGDDATKSLLAFFPGGLIIVPAIMSLVNGVGRMGRAQEVGLGVKSINGWVILGIFVGGFIIPFLSLVAYGYMQSELNSVWENIDRQQGQLAGGADPYAAPVAQDAYAQPAAPPPPPPPNV